MDLKVTIVDQVRVVTVLEPTLSTATAREFKTQMLELIKTGPPHLLVNMSRVINIDSSALGMLGLVYKACKLQGEFGLCEVGKNVQTLLRMTKLDQVFHCFSTVDEGVAALMEKMPAEQAVQE